MFCEELYSKTTLRNSEGRYLVSLLFKCSMSEDIYLGHSRNNAYTQFIRNEKNLCRKPEFKCQYDRVLHEYCQLEHMKKVSASRFEYKPLHFYLPHHAVIKPESTTTKLGVVFNASNPTSNGLSLNDILYTGPSLQNDLTMLLVKWRFFKFVFNGDITKMYRQILVDPRQTPFQRILFRKSPEEKVQDFELNSAGFNLRKWTSNSKDILEDIPKDHLLNQDFLCLEDESCAKTLVIRWNAVSDTFYFNAQTIPLKVVFSKREVLSIIAKLFDPAGWLSPIVITANILMHFGIPISLSLII